MAGLVPVPRAEFENELRVFDNDVDESFSVSIFGALFTQPPVGVEESMIC